MKKQKPLILNISEVSSSDDESQAKPHKEDLKNTLKTVIMNQHKKLHQNLLLKNQKLKRKN